PLPIKIVQTPGVILTLFEEFTVFRQIFTDGRKLPVDPTPTWFGYSVANWDKNTLVVESSGFNEQTYLDGEGLPHSEDLRITERYRRSDFGHLVIEFTFTDPKNYERGRVRIYYEEAGSGFPLLLIPGGGLNSTISFFTGNSPFNAIEEFKGEYRSIAADLRNAPSGQSTGPVEVDRPWESYADDQLGLMDHLGIDKFSVMGFCIGGPFIWSLLKRAPTRIAPAVLAQPVGWRPEMRDPKYPGT